MRPTTTRLIAAAALLLGMSVQAQAQTIRLTAILSGSNETPAPGVVTGATGTAEVFVNLANNEVTYTVRVFNLPSGAIGGHFHVGGPDGRRSGGGQSGAPRPTSPTTSR